MKTDAFSLFLIFLAGCGNQGTAPTAETPSKPGPTTSSKVAEVETPLPPANSAEDLAAAFKAAYERGDRVAIEKMVYSEGITADHLDWNLRAIFNISSADGINGKVEENEVRDVPEGMFKPDTLTLPPVKMMFGITSGDRGSGEVRAPIGEVDGDFYFCARKPVSPTR